MNHVWYLIHALQAFLTADRIISILTLLVAIVGAYYAKKALTKRDLKELENHAAATSGHLAQQREREELRSIATRAPIELTGRNYQDEPLLVYFSVKEKQLTLTSVDLLHPDDDTRYGSSPCNKVASGTFTAQFRDQGKLRSWFDAGRPINASQVRVRLRIHIAIADRREERTMTVTLGSFNVGDERKPDMPPTRVWEIGGTV